MELPLEEYHNNEICSSKEENCSDGKNYICNEQPVEYQSISNIQCDEVTGSAILDEGIAIGGGGSDSGVEGCSGRAFSSAGRSCTSSASVVSCGSESSSLAAGSCSGDATVASSIEQRKKKVAVAEPTSIRRQPVGRSVVSRGPNLATRERARSREKATTEKPRPLTPKPALPPRIRPRSTLTIPSGLPALQRESPAYKAKPTKTSTARCRTPGTPPDDPKGTAFHRSPLHSVMTLSRTSETSVKNKMTDSKTFDKYATLPRRRREVSPDDTHSERENNTRHRAISTSRKTTRDRDSPIMRTLPPYPRNKSHKTKIYHETCVQTALVGHDIECALAGIGIKEIRTDLILVEKSNKGVQADGRSIEIEKLEAKVRQLTEANAKLQQLADVQKQKLVDGEVRLEEERTEKMAVQEELQRNTQRVLAMLGQESSTNENGSDSLMVLESQLQTSANIVVKQQEEINKLHKICRSLRQELDRSTFDQHQLEQQLLDAECEHTELQDFLATEKAALQDAMKDLEEENSVKSTKLTKLRAECGHLVRISEQRRQEALGLQARVKKLQGVLYGGTAMPTTEGALPVLESLIKRLQSLLDTLVASYKISKEDLEEVVYHNEAYSCTGSSCDNSPVDTNETKTPCDTTQQQKPTKSSGGSSLLSAFMSAIRNATGVMTASQPVNDPQDEDPKLSDDENSADLLDSETEPCIMMENVLEDVTMPDTYSQNLVSSGLSLMTSSINQVLPLSPSSILMGDSRPRIVPGLALNRQLGYYNKDDSCNSLHNFANFSGDELSPVNRENNITSDAEGKDDTYEYSEHESLQNLSQAIINRQQSEAECSLSEDLLSKDDMNDDMYYKNYLVDKVILVDVLITKLLKVLRIIQLENESTVQQMNAIKEKLSIIDKSVADTVSSKLEELDKCKDKVLQYRTTIEELNMKLDRMKKTNGSTSNEEQATLLRSKSVPHGHQSERSPGVRMLQERLRTQYEAIDKALHVFHSVQTVVSDCPELAALQADLETFCFQMACEAAIPPVRPKPSSPRPRISDCNANAAQPINSAA